VLSFLSPQVKDLTGYTAEELLADSPALAELIEPGDRERVRGSRETAQVGDRVDLEFRLRHKNGAIVWVLDRARVCTAPDGSVILVGCLVDRRAQKRTEAQRLQQARLATLGELAAGLAHEINNPLSGVLNYAQLAKRVVEKGECDHGELLDTSLEGILAEGNRILEITQSLLTLARPNDGAFRPQGANELVRASLTPLRCLLRDDFILITVETEDDLLPMRVRGHGLRQVLQNLLLNARHALNSRFAERDPNKRVTVRTGATDEGVYYEVEDRGVGMDDTAQARVFEAFYTTRTDGTGLGLSVSREIVSAHGGTLTVESVPGEGATFRVTVPRWGGA
jgi:PAS domain S-box-containing protein